MARAARSTRRKATRLGLLAALCASCAVIQQPPGGPPDFAAPTIVSVRPDSGAVVPDFDDAVEIQFDEVITENPGGGLDRLIEVSPRPEQLRVQWKRSRITVEPTDGWRPGIVYHVVLAPGITDLRNNRMEEGLSLIFSTGGDIPDTRIDGVVIDWEAGRPGLNALVEAVLMPDSLVYVTHADSSGEFSLTQVPRGSYTLYATIDNNSSNRRDLREAFDSVSVALDSTASHVFWTFTPDTLGPQIRGVEPADSLTAEIEFNQMLAPVAPDLGAVRVWLLPDTVGVSVHVLWEKAAYDSVRVAERAVADSIAAEQAEPDSAAAAPDSAAAPEPAVAIRPPRGRPRVPAVPDSAQVPDTTRAERLLDERPVLADRWYFRLLEPLAPGARYLVEAEAQGIAGATGVSRAVLIIPEPEPPDTTQAPAPDDSTRAPAEADTSQAPVPEDST